MVVAAAVVVVVVMMVVIMPPTQTLSSRPYNETQTTRNYNNIKKIYITLNRQLCCKLTKM